MDQRARAGDRDPGAHARLAAAGRPALRRGRPRRARRVRGEPAARRPHRLAQRARPPLPHLLLLHRPARAQRLPAVARRPLRLRARDRRPPRAAAVPTGDRAARREIPRYDTGAWSLYASGGAESDLGYHRLVRDFLQSLCERTKAGAYCGRGEEVRPLPARAHARRLRRRRRRPPRRRRERPLHALQALVRDAAGAARRQAGAGAQARHAARPARAHLPPAARRPPTRSRSRPSTCSTTTRAWCTRPQRKRAPRAEPCAGRSCAEARGRR